MSDLIGNTEFTHGNTARIGVLLCNLGTPDEPTPRAVRRYLAEFLSDPRVVELPRLLWLPLLHGVILNIRPRRSAHAYAKIWTEEGSPLLRLSDQLTEGLAQQLSAIDDRIVCELGMRYGKPAISAAIDRLLAANARRILVVPLYPQYASATTASVSDAVGAHLSQLRWVPEMRFVSDWHERPDYISALAQSVREHWAEHGRGERLLMSFHGIPRDTFLAGDPYFCQCQATGRLLAEALELTPQQWQLSFQSRVGPKAWLEPYTEQTLRDWGAEGVGDIDVICPGFAVDCLETLEEIALQNAAIFRETGGGALRYIAALNARDSHLAMLRDLVGEHTQSWLEAQPQDADSRQAVAARARTLGGR